MHAARVQRHGDPDIVLKPKRRQAEMNALLKSGAEATADDCIIMDSMTNDRPIVRLKGKRMTASRASWIIAHGDPGEFQVLHRCNGGNGANGCINIRHLYLGTRSQNALDMWAARRARGISHS